MLPVLKGLPCTAQDTRQPHIQNAAIGLSHEAEPSPWQHMLLNPKQHTRRAYTYTYT